MSDAPRTRYIQPGGMTPTFRAVHAYRAAAEAFDQARKARDAYWAEHHHPAADGQTLQSATFDRLRYHQLHSRCVAAHVERDARAAAASINPYSSEAKR